MKKVYLLILVLLITSTLLKAILVCRKQSERFLRNRNEFQNNISISGGDENNSFAMSYGNTYSDGVIPTRAISAVHGG